MKLSQQIQPSVMLLHLQVRLFVVLISILVSQTHLHRRNIHAMESFRGFLYYRQQTDL